MEHLLQCFEKNPVVAAVRDVDLMEKAVNSDVEVLFLMTGGISNIQYCVETAKKKNKLIFLHVDLLKGIARDKEGIRYLAHVIQPDGIITTKNNLIRMAKKEGLIAIQHLFLLDTQAFASGVRNIKEMQPDAVEIMPGLMPRVIRDLREKCPVPIISAGLIHSADEITAALHAGSDAVAVGADNLWNTALQLVKGMD